MKALSIKDLSFGYGEHVVLKNISLEVEQGSYVSLIGHNGSGKSTLAKLIVGLLPFDKGEITISGVELNKDNLNEIRNKVAIVFQNPDKKYSCLKQSSNIHWYFLQRLLTPTKTAIYHFRRLNLILLKYSAINL